MKHSNTELFKIEGMKGVFTAEAVRGYKGAYRLPQNPEPAKGCRRVWMNVNKTMSKIIYTYGEKTWFDTAEERDAYRVEQSKLREKAHIRAVQLRELKEELDECSAEQLKQITAIVRSIKRKGEQYQ